MVVSRGPASASLDRRRSDSPFQDTEATTHRRERFNGALDVAALVRCGQLDTNARLVSGYHRKAEVNHVHPLKESEFDAELAPVVPAFNATLTALRVVTAGPTCGGVNSEQARLSVRGLSEL